MDEEAAPEGLNGSGAGAGFDLQQAAALRPGPFRLDVPTVARAGLIVCCPHSGRFYPHDLLQVSKLGEMALRRSEDAFVDELMAATAELGGHLLAAVYGRSYVDLNRAPDELDPELIGAIPAALKRVPTARVLAGLGVIPRTVGEGVEIYRGRLSYDVAEARLSEVYFPWHAQIHALIHQALAAFGQAVMLDCHSMPAAASGLHESDIVLGDRFGGACAPILMAEATRFLKEAGLRVARNNPYAGGYATEHYGKPGQNQHCLQIEINRSLYMVEGAMTKRPAFESVAATMAGLVGHIVDVAESLALKHAS